MFPNILIVDDEPSNVQALTGLLADEGFGVLSALNGYEALKAINENVPDLVLLDIWMPGMDGLETLKEIKKDYPEIPVVIITGHGNIETAIKATKAGAFDLIEKPLSFDKIVFAINKALSFRQMEEENRYLRKKSLDKNAINGVSPQISALKANLMKAAMSDAWVLITGEHGTGKELVVRNLHLLSSRSNAPLVSVSCAAIDSEMLDSELFGHEKGAVTHAVSKQIGKFELANGGTLFLDEIADMNLQTQAKMLRVLEEKKITRLGNNRDIPVDVRVVATTNRDLAHEIAAGRFREDLFFRLNVVPLHVPALRERPEDIPALCDFFLKSYAQLNGLTPKTLTPAALKILQRNEWPGNVRELKNLIERLVIVMEGDVIDTAHLPPPYAPTPLTVCDAAAVFEADDLKKAWDQFEQLYIQKALAANNLDPSLTAQALNISKNLLVEELKVKE